MWSKSDPAAPVIASGYDTAAAKRYCYCRMDAKHFDLQPQLRLYWLHVAVTVRDHCGVSILCRQLTSDVDRGDEGSQQSQRLGGS